MAGAVVRRAATDSGIRYDERSHLEGDGGHGVAAGVHGNGVARGEGVNHGLGLGSILELRLVVEGLHGDKHREVESSAAS